MVYAPPLIRPPLPPLRPPVAPPYRPPVLAPPPTQIDPGYEPPTLLPPTDIDLKGIICIYSNAPLWEPKKIRYRYPGENWQEIAGDRYTLKIESGWNPLPLVEYLVVFSAKLWCMDPLPPERPISVIFSGKAVGGFRLENIISNPPMAEGKLLGIIGQGSVILEYLSSKKIILWDQNGINNRGDIGPYGPAYEYSSFTCDRKYVPDWMPPSIPDHGSIPQVQGCVICSTWPWIYLNINAFFHTNGDPRQGYACQWGSIKIDSVIRVSDNQDIPPIQQCAFKVFNIFNQEILSITRDDCPEVIVIPEKCYFKAENERLVARVMQTLLDPPLRIEYQGNCATVWKDGILNLPPYPLQIYKECSDNPNCPPPRIRFDKKCEEKCEQCPPGTAIKVLLGSRIACVDSVGCVLKSIKYKPGCNNYDCICS